MKFVLVGVVFVVGVVACAAPNKNTLRFEVPKGTVLRYAQTVTTRMENPSVDVRAEDGSALPAAQINVLKTMLEASLKNQAQGSSIKSNVTQTVLAVEGDGTRFFGNTNKMQDGTTVISDYRLRPNGEVVLGKFEILGGAASKNAPNKDMLVALETSLKSALKQQNFGLYGAALDVGQTQDSNLDINFPLPVPGAATTGINLKAKYKTTYRGLQKQQHVFAQSIHLEPFSWKYSNPAQASSGLEITTVASDGESRAIFALDGRLVSQRTDLSFPMTMVVRQRQGNVGFLLVLTMTMHQSTVLDLQP